jgi:glutaminyl-tRNA synthetase
MGAYLVTCTGYETDAEGNVTEIRCTADLETATELPADGHRTKGSIHWVSAAHCVDAEIREYGRLFSEANMVTLRRAGILEIFSIRTPSSCITAANSMESLAKAPADERFQFVRSGYFIRDSKYEGTWNEIVGLKDTWAKVSGD